MFCSDIQQRIIWTNKQLAKNIYTNEFDLLDIKQFVSPKQRVKKEYYYL